MRGVPLPERLVAKRTQAAVGEILKEAPLPKDWQAGVSKVEMCALAEYDGGRGLKTVFPEGESPDPKKRCTILCTGSTDKLTISLEVASSHQEPYPRVLHKVEIPSEDDRVGLRLYDVDVSIEIREHPRNPKQRKPSRRAEYASGECWVIHLETSLKESVLVKAKKMLRRLESVTNAMPSEWFSYRNYDVKHDVKESATGSKVEFRDGVFTQTFAGGYTWRFTGNLASKEFREALEGKFPDDKPREEVPTRVQPPRTAKGKKAAKKLPGKQRRLKRVQQRTMAVDEPELESDQVPEGSAKLHPIEGLLDKRTIDGDVQYKVQWTGNDEPSWQPARNISAEDIADFEKKRTKNSSVAGEKKGRPSKKKPAKASVANGPMTRSATKAAKKSAE